MPIFGKGTLRQGNKKLANPLDISVEIQIKKKSHALLTHTQTHTHLLV